MLLLFTILELFVYSKAFLIDGASSATCTDAKPICDFMNDTYQICSDFDLARAHCQLFCNLCDVVDGSWSEWSAWAACDVTCGTGTSSRLRQCNNPAPVHGGHDCVGQTSEIKLCIDQKCPETCLPGWTQHGQICYHLSTEKENWPGAESICRMFGGTLAEARTTAERDYITSVVKHHSRKYWIGLNDLSLEDEWRWIGSGKLAVATLWYPGQPDNDKNNENCVYTDGSHDGKWIDEQCPDHFNYYICEKRLDEINQFS
ncbi:brevican core protein-like isoform X2 [Mya arenaria]|uniref:brevican core protein-like isoform X2 n=1 Tax=Mya arenaria TaxID=6604 RepID=UPI0022E0BC15|nr:brevican core protein-like isoform X2 [Mya arenaria]